MGLVRVGVAATLASLLFAPCPSLANEQPFRAQERTSPYLRVHGVTQPPYGFVDFCNREPQECREDRPEETRVAGNKDQLAELDRVNRMVNRDVKPFSDQELYGVPEFWTVAKGKGDCEDYALLKRQILMRSGWPASALLLTVVLDEKGEGHAILTARTASGDYVLDNKTDEMKLWSKTPYRYVMRQSYLSVKIWMSLDPDQAAPTVPIAGVRNRR